jgi:hypothetical protein
MNEHVNWEIIKDLESKTSAAVIKKLLVSFDITFFNLINYEDKINQLDLKELKSKAHQLKSTGAMLGAMKLSKLSELVEKSEDLKDENIFQLILELKRVLEEFKSNKDYN